MAATDTIRTWHEELTALRRDNHAHPDLGFTEHRTAALVARARADCGIEVHRGIGRTGVAGMLRCGNGAASIGLRADMGALPIQEATGVGYASELAERRLPQRSL